MAESPSVYSARSQLSPPDSANEVVEVQAEVAVDSNWTTPVRRTRLFEAASREQASRSPRSPRYLTRLTNSNGGLIDEDVAEDDNEEGDGDGFGVKEIALGDGLVPNQSQGVGRISIETPVHNYTDY